MAKDNKISLPSSSAGLTSFYSEYNSNFVFKPGHVIAMIILVIIFEIVLHTFL